MNANSYGRGHGYHPRPALSAAIRWGARRRVVSALLIIAVAILCSPMLASVPAHATVASASSCAFLPVASDADILPAKEDVHAGYYVGSLPDSGNESFVVHGQFPHSVMLTWVVYDANAQIYSTLTDQQITPDPGSVNPFTSTCIGARHGLRMATAPGTPTTPC